MQQDDMSWLLEEDNKFLANRDAQQQQEQSAPIAQPEQPSEMISEEQMLAELLAPANTGESSDMVAPSYDVSEEDMYSQLMGTSTEQVDSASFQGIEKEEDLRDFSYGWDSSRTFSENAGDYFEARLPLGNISLTEGYISPNELYGEDFMDLSVDERRVRIRQVKDAELAKEYPRITELKAQGEYEAGAAGFLGTMAGTLADPTTFAPIGKKLPTVFAMGSAIGASYSIAEDLVSESGDIDAKKAAITAGVAGVGSVVANQAFKMAGKAMARRKDAKALQAANDKVEEVNLAVSKGVANDISEADMPAYIKSETGLDPEDVSEYVLAATNTLRIPTSKAAAELEQEAVKAVSIQRGATAEFFDNILGSASTRLRDIAPQVMNRARRLDYLTTKNTHKYLQRAEPMFKALKSVSKGMQPKLYTALDNGEFKVVERILRQEVGEDGVKAFQGTQQILRELYTELSENGVKMSRVENYFPREVKNVDKLVQSLGGTTRGKVEKALYEAAQKAGARSVKDLDVEVKEEVINHVMRGIKPREGSKAGYQKQRQIGLVTEDLLKHYQKPHLALEGYIRRTVNDIEKRKFLGRNNVVNQKGSNWKIDVDASVGKFTAELLDSGELGLRALDEVADTIGIRMGMGEKKPMWMLQKLRDLGYGTTLANPMSALIQYGDVGSAAYQSKIKNTAKAMIAGDKRVSMREMGLDDLINNELNTAMEGSKLLGNALSWSGFRAADRHGKNVVLRAAFNKAVNQVKSEKGIRELSKKYRKQFGNDEFNALVKELQNNEVTDRVKFMLWNELADVQPISLIEMPKAYLNNPNGRIFYALKSFAIKQIDMMRRGIYAEARRGNKVQAAKNALAFTMFVGGTNAGVQGFRNMLYGRDDFNDFVANYDDRIVEHVAGLLFFDKFTRERQLGQGELLSTVAEKMMPPLSVLEAPAKDVIDLMKEDFPEDRVPFGRTISKVPGFGTLFDNYLNGGLERYIERKEREEDRD